MSNEFDFDDNPFDTSDDELFKSDNNDATPSDDVAGMAKDDFASKRNAETASERKARVQERDDIRAKIGWSIPKYADLVEEAEGFQARYAELKTQFEELRSEGKEKSPEAIEILKERAGITKKINDLKTINNHIATIEKAPTSFKNIIQYGSDVTSSLGRLSDQIIEMEATSTNDDFTVFSNTMAEVKAVAESKDIKAATELISNHSKTFGTAAANAGVAVVSKGADLGKGLWKKVFGGKLEAEEKETAKDMEKEEALRVALFDKHKTIKNAKETIGKIEISLINQAAKVKALGDENMKAVGNLKLLIVAGDEVARRYSEEWIPVLIEKHEQEPSAETERDLTDFESSYSDFLGKLVSLESTMFKARGDIFDFLDQHEQNKAQIKIVQNMKATEVDRWMTALAKLILQGGNIVKTRKLLEHADIGRGLDDIGINMAHASAKIRKQLGESEEKEIINMLENRTAMMKVLEDTKVAEVKRSKKQLEMRDRLKDGEAEMAQMKDKFDSQARQIRDDSRKKLANHSSSSAATPATNDNVEESPATSGASDVVAAAAKKRAAAKKNGNGM